ncbi:MerC domain-containing protein [Jiulongibacter sediminis]|uniref:MerC domain-containing protein n=1 Tax=Jiulongibacter sediminis TaxID=1605367 RepID=UPI0009EA104A|nr:MerC domain-containing protein [Jiulongibacter sediminis]
MKRLKEKYSHLLYKLGLGMSFLCAIHCLSMPFILVALPTLGEHFLPEFVENILVVSSMLIAIYLLSRDFRHHQNRLPFLLLGISAGLYTLDFFATHHLFSILGSVSMAAAYVLNWRLHRKSCHVPL